MHVAYFTAHTQTQTNNAITIPLFTMRIISSINCTYLYGEFFFHSFDLELILLSSPRKATKKVETKLKQNWHEQQPENKEIHFNLVIKINFVLHFDFGMVFLGMKRKE